MPRKKAEEESDDDVQIIPVLRKSARIASKGSTPSRETSIKEASSAALTPSRRSSKKSGSVESDASLVTPSRRTSKRLSVSEHAGSEQPEELLELPTPTRRRTTSVSSVGSVTTPRRGTRAAASSSLRPLPVLQENDSDVEDVHAVETRVKESAAVPKSAQKRYGNLASNLVKMMETPKVKGKLVLDDDEEEEREKEKKATPAKKEETPKSGTPAKAATPKQTKTPEEKKGEGEEVVFSSDDEPMDWEEGPQKTPLMFHPKSAAKSGGRRVAQLVPDAAETPTTRAARRGRPSSAVIFGEEAKSEEKDEEEVVLPPAKCSSSPLKEASPAKKPPPNSPIKEQLQKVVSPVKSASPAKKSPSKSPVKEKSASPIKEKIEEEKKASPKKSPAKLIEEEEEGDEDEEEEEEDGEAEARFDQEDEELDDEDEEDEEDEDEEEEENEGEEGKEEEAVREIKKTSPQKMTEEELEEEDEDDDMDEEEDEDEEEEEEEEGEDGLFPAVSFKKMFDGSVDFDSALEQVYAWTFKRGSTRVDDLPGRLVNGSDRESVWQQVEHRNAQIAKDSKKAKKAGLFEKDIELIESEKKRKKRNLDKEEEEDDDEEDGIQFDDEDMMDEEGEEGDEDEDEDEEEEEEGNLFDMTEEELSRLDEDLKAMEAEGDEEEEEERPKKKKKAAKEHENKSKKFPKSSVDDRFFSLAEMEAAADAMEKDGAIEEGIFDDEEEGDAAYTYDEFFGAENDDDVFGGKKKKKMMRMEEEDDDEGESSIPVKKGKKKDKKAEDRKSVSWKDEDHGGDLREEHLIEPSGKMRRLTAAALHGGLDEEEEGMEKKEGEEEEERILLGPADDDREEKKTPLKGSVKSIKKRIAQLEEENLESRKWDLQGEVGGEERGENTLLEQHVEFDHGMTRAPTITEDFNEKIEAIVLQRWKDKAWDDPVRTVRAEERTEEYRNKLVDEDLLIKQSLSSVYEKEYEKAQEGAAAASSGTTAVNPKHAEIDAEWDALFGLVDPLFHFNVTPQQAKAEIKVITNVKALQQEEVGAMMSTEEMLIAPEEVKKREKGTIKGKEERDSTDKKRERRKKKQKQRAVVLTRGEDGLKRMLEATENKDENGEPVKKKKKKQGKEAAASAPSSNGGKFKSTDFFTKLQTTVQNELIEKTKKAKVKSAAGGKANSAKFKL